MNSAPAGKDVWLTVKEICFEFGRHRSTIWRWQQRGLPMLQGRVLLSVLLLWMKKDEDARRVAAKKRRDRRTRARRKAERSNTLQPACCGKCGASAEHWRRDAAPLRTTRNGRRDSSRGKVTK